MPGALLPDTAPPARVLVVGCGALGRELVALTRHLPGIDLTCLPAELHNRPERIPDAVAARLRARGGDYDRVFVAYADCGTGGLLDRMLERDFGGVERIPGAHCYEFFAGAAAFVALQEEEVGTFYLTDFLARNFERIVWRGLGLEQHPELLGTYFGSYRRLVYLAQTEDPELVERARGAADRLGLAFEVQQTGLGDLDTAIRGAVRVTTRDADASGNLPGAAATGPSRPTLSPRVPVASAPGRPNRPKPADVVAVGGAMASASPGIPLTPARGARSRRSPT
jgi:Protein of unknown function (DUF1638)